MLSRAISEDGAARIRRMMLVGDPIDVPTALASGIAHTVVPPKLVDATVEGTAKRLSRRDPNAMRITKRALAHAHAPEELGSVQSETLATTLLLRHASPARR